MRDIQEIEGGGDMEEVAKFNVNTREYVDCLILWQALEQISGLLGKKRSIVNIRETFDLVISSSPCISHTQLYNNICIL